MFLGFKSLTSIPSARVVRSLIGFGPVDVERLSTPVDTTHAWVGRNMYVRLFLTPHPDRCRGVMLLLATPSVKARQGQGLPWILMWLVTIDEAKTLFWFPTCSVWMGCNAETNYREVCKTCTFDDFCFSYRYRLEGRCKTDGNTIYQGIQGRRSSPSLSVIHLGHRV